MHNRKVTVIIPCRNEEEFLQDCLNSLIGGDYPLNSLEIFCVDGMSTDRTAGIIHQYEKDHQIVKRIENPALIFPAAVNAGVRASSGDVIMIAGAHAVYPPDYISECVRYLYELNADNVGGILNTEGKNEKATGRMITAVLSNPFGVGNSHFRTGIDKVAEVDTVFGGCYRKEVFERIGFFNENLVSTSDLEFNKRLVRSGGKIFIVPSVHCTYYTRSTFGRFMRNNFRNGYWVVYPRRFLKESPVSLRHMVPLLFFTALVAGIALSILLPYVWIAFVAVSGLYGLAALYFAGRHSAGRMKAGIVIAPFFFFMLHASYGLGSLCAAVKLIFLKRKWNG